MAMALVDGRIGRQEIEESPPVRVRDPRSGRTLDDDIQRMVVMRSVLLFQFDQVGLDRNHGTTSRFSRITAASRSAASRKLVLERPKLVYT